MSKEKYTLEYPFNSAPQVLFNRLSTASGLSEWFADDVFVNENCFTFIWEGSEQKAEMIKKKAPVNVKYRWLDEDMADDEDVYFEFKINKDDLTGETALIITDFAEEDEKQEAIELWDTQINILKQRLGL